MWNRLFPSMSGRDVARRAFWTILIVAIAVALTIGLALTVVQTGSDYEQG